jgi:hypothetical protein
VRRLAWAASPGRGQALADLSIHGLSHLPYWLRIFYKLPNLGQPYRTVNNGE